MNIFYILLLSFNIIYCKEVLRHVHVFYRHGDRAPSHLFSDDVKKLDMWPYGFGQLTDIGINQQFALGKWLRLRYKSFIKPTYDFEEIKVTSTAVDRTLMSAESNLAGLYYDNHKQIITGLNWRPIPIHSIPRLSDTLVLPKEHNVYRKNVEKMYKTKWYNDLYAQYQPTLDIMRKVSKNKDLKFEESWYIYDSLFCEKSHNITLDPWVNKEIYENITKIYNLSWKMMYHGDQLARLSGGRVLNNVVNQLKDFVKNNKSEKEKIKMISGHDTDISAILSAIGEDNGDHPPYAACIMIELIHRPTNDPNLLKNWIVKIYYKTSSTDSPRHLPEKTLRGCKSYPCTLSDFADFVKPRLLHDNGKQITNSAYKSLGSLAKMIFLVLKLTVNKLL